MLDRVKSIKSLSPQSQWVDGVMNIGQLQDFLVEYEC